MEIEIKEHNSEKIKELIDSAKTRLKSDGVEWKTQTKDSYYERHRTAILKSPNNQQEMVIEMCEFKLTDEADSGDSAPPSYMYIVWTDMKDRGVRRSVSYRNGQVILEGNNSLRQYEVEKWESGGLLPDSNLHLRDFEKPSELEIQNASRLIMLATPNKERKDIFFNILGNNSGFELVSPDVKNTMVDENNKS